MQDFLRIPLAVLSTPIQKLENISRLLNTNVYIKRDDLTGIGLGGNKIRKLEFLLADAKRKGAEVVFTTGGAQSNHAMLTAACAKKLGMEPILILKKRGVTERKGNQLLKLDFTPTAENVHLIDMCGPGYTIPGEFAQNGFLTNNLAHTEGVLSMARAMDPDSAGSQFFIMHKTSPHLDGAYAAFGKVIEGMDVVNAIAEAATDFRDRPLEEQKLASVTVETFGVEYPEPEKC